MEGVITVVVMSDSHGKHRDVVIPECDILIHAGDISNFNRQEHYEDFFPWFSSRSARYKIFIGGNHDDMLESEERREFLKRFPELNHLDGNMVEVMGLKIWGSAVQPKAFDMAFCRDREQRERTWDNLPSGVDIVVSHCPPYGILDKNSVGKHVGCSVLGQALEQRPPLLSVFGHIHEAHGVTSKIFDGRQCVFANCSVVNRGRKVVNKPQIFKFVDGKVVLDGTI